MTITWVLWGQLMPLILSTVPSRGVLCGDKSPSNHTLLGERTLQTRWPLTMDCVVFYSAVADLCFSMWSFDHRQQKATFLITIRPCCLRLSCKLSSLCVGIIIRDLTFSYTCITSVLHCNFSSTTFAIWDIFDSEYCSQFRAMQIMINYRVLLLYDFTMDSKGKNLLHSIIITKKFIKFGLTCSFCGGNFERCLHNTNKSCLTLKWNLVQNNDTFVISTEPEQFKLITKLYFMLLQYLVK